MSNLPIEETLSVQVPRVATILSSDTFPTGTRAALKRFSPGQALPIEFYSFAYRYLPNGWDRNEDSWATIVAGISLMSPSAHDSHIPYGQALAESGYSNLRLERLLQSEGQVQRTLFLRSVRFLAQKSVPFNWVEGASFILTEDQIRRELINSRIARDYYRRIDKE